MLGQRGHEQARSCSGSAESGQRSAGGVQGECMGSAGAQQSLEFAGDSCTL